MNHDKQSERDELARAFQKDITTAFPCVIMGDIWDKIDQEDRDLLLWLADRELALKTSLDEALAEIERLKTDREGWVRSALTTMKSESEAAEKKLYHANTGWHEETKRALEAEKERDNLKAQVNDLAVLGAGYARERDRFREERDEALAEKFHWQQRTEISRKECDLLRVENERLKADCAAMRDGYLSIARGETGGYGEDPEGAHSNASYIACSFTEKENPGSDLLAELLALRDVAQAAFEKNDLKLIFAFDQLHKLKGLGK